MIQVVFNVPTTQDEWDRWSFHHRLSHTAIRQALAALGRQTNDYLIDPIYEDDFPGFLQRNAQYHTEMNLALGSQGADIQDVDLHDEAQKVAWIYLHWQEHQTAEQRLGIGS